MDKFLCICLILVMSAQLVSSRLHPSSLGTRNSDKQQRLRSASEQQIGSFSGFRDQIANALNIDGELLNSPKVKDWYNKEVKGTELNLKDHRQIARVTGILSSMLCSACQQRRDCGCLRRLQCFNKC